MIWITKYRHNKIVAEYSKHITDLKEALNRKDLLIAIVEKLTDKVNNFGVTRDLEAVSASIARKLDDSVAVYVDDYFGGKVIKQEATPVTILDIHGKATYGLTAQKADKGKNYILFIDPSK